MALTIDLRNAGIIREAHLEFISGLNLILGSSSSGKSTLLRTLRSFVENSFTDANVTFGQQTMAIRIQDGEHTYVYMRDLSSRDRKAQYQIDGDTFTKVGRNPLEELKGTLKLSSFEIDEEQVNFNFSSQFAGPFLLLGSPSLLYSILTYRDSFDITRMTDLYSKDLKKVKSDISVSNKLKTKLESEQASISESIKSLAGIESVYTKLHDVKLLDRQVIGLGELLDKLEELKCKAEQSKNKVAQATKALESLKDVLSVGEKVLNLTPALSSLRELHDEATKLTKYIAVANRVCSFDLQMLEKTYRDRDRLKSWCDFHKKGHRVKSLLDNLKDFSSELRTLSDLRDLSKCLHQSSVCKSKLNHLDIDLELPVQRISTVRRIRTLLGSKSSCESILTHLIDTSEDLSRLHNLNELRDEYVMSGTVLETIHSFDSELNCVQTSLSSFNICPLCEQAIEHTH